MKQIIYFCLYFVCWILLCYGRLGADEPVLPKWIATSDSNVRNYRMMQSVNLDDSVLSGRMKLAVDFARATVTINDSIGLKVEPYCQLQLLDVTQWLKSGENKIAIDVECVNGPSAIAAEFELRLNSGKVVHLVSDESWTRDVGSSTVSVHRIAAGSVARCAS